MFLMLKKNKNILLNIQPNLMDIKTVKLFDMTLLFTSNNNKHSTKSKEICV